MSYLSNDVNNPSIQIDSVAIGLQLNDQDEAKNLNILDLEKHKEFLVVGEKTYNINTTDTINTKWNLIVNDNGVAINTSRHNANINLTHDTSLYVDKNIHCSGIIKASGLQISNIILDNTNPITCNLVKDFIIKTNELALLQPFKYSIYNTDFSNNYNSYNNYTIKNLYTPEYITFGGETDTYNNTNPLNIVTTPNSKFDNMHISIRNDTNNDYNEPIRMCIGIIGGYKESPAIISTTRGVPLEFHVSKSAESIDTSYGNNAVPIYNVASNIPAMTIDANHNVGIGTNICSKYIYQQKSMQNNKTNNKDVEDYARLDVKGLVAFENILIKDYVSGVYKNTDDIYIRNSGIGVLNATQINEGSFTGNNYSFNNNLSVNNLLNAKNINVESNIEIFKNTKTDSLNVVNESIFNGEVVFNKNVNFQNTNILSIKNLNFNIENDIFINNRRLLPIDLSDPFTGYTKTINNNGSNFILMYISSNIASLDANSNINFPKKLGLGLTQHDTFDAVLNIVKDDNSTSNIFDITLKNTANNKNYIANIGRLSRLDYNDNSLIVNTNYINGKKNNIYFYPETDIKSLPNNYLSSNIKNIYPTLSLLKNSVGINKINPNSNFALDINGNISSVEYFIYADNNYKKTKTFIYNKEKNYFNIFDKLCDKYCINYSESGELAIDMKGLNVKKGINTDNYFQNNILIETLKRASNNSSFYTNKYISIGWKNEENVVPLQIRNINVTDYNYSTIRIYRGTMGGGKYNNADYSGIDICEYDRDINSDRNKERWFIYKNHKYNDKDSRDKKRVGPLQIGYTNKTIEPTTYGMSFYYNTSNSMYHIDVNNPNITYNDTSAMTIYGDLSVHGNINILDINGCNFNFNMRGVSSQLQRVEKYLDNISCNILNNAYINLPDDKIITSFDIFRPKDNIIIDPIIDNEIPLIVKNINNGNDIKPVSKFITYSKNDISYSSIELAIYNSNLYYYYDNNDMYNNIKSSIEISTNYNKNNLSTILDFNILNNGSYKNFLKFINTNNVSGDIVNSIAHIGIGDNINSNILLHIDGNSKYGMQITNKSYPACINLVNTEGGKDIYYNISGGDYNNNNKFSIGVAAKNYNDYEPDIKNIFTIDAFKNNELRKGVRFGFNEDFSNITNLNSTNSATFVINSEYNNISTSITNRYTNDHIYSSLANIEYINISLLNSSNWNNTIKTYDNSITQNIYIFPETDTDNNKINSNENLNQDFIIKKNYILSSKLFYTTIHKDINYANNYSNLIIAYNNYNNYNIITEYLPEISKYNNTITNNIIEILPSKLFDSINDDLISEHHYIEEKIYHDINYLLNNSNMIIKYQYNNNYKKSSNINYYVDISNDAITNSTIDNSNNINVSNNIITTLLPFDNSKHVTNIIYTDIHRSKIFIDDDSLEYPNLYLNTFTNNIIRYNSNINYDEKYYSIHSNYLNINSSNTYIEKLLNDTLIFRVSSNIIDNNIFIKTSNYSINEIIDDDNKQLILLNSNVFLDSFNILGYTCNNTLIIEDYINEYSNIDNKKFNIGIKNYNKTKYYPHISLINNIDNDVLSIRNTHDIYSYDGIFEIKYNDVLENDFTALRIDKQRNLYTGGDIFTFGALDIGTDLRIAGNIYDVHGNNLIEILNNNYYKNYVINASNIYLNYSGSNGVEINVSSSEKYDNYNLLYIKDYISSNVFNDIFVLSKSSNLNMDNFNLNLYTDLYVHCNLHIEGYGDKISLLIEQKSNSNIISASNLSREVFTLANDGSLGLGVVEPQSVLMNMRQINGSNIISASNLSREVFTLANDGSIGLGVVDPQSVLMNMRQINGSNIISASNLSREVFTLANDGSLGLGVTYPQSVLMNMRQINGSNIISASNLSREVFTLANDGSLGLGVVDPQSVLMNMRQINGSNIISASNLSREVFTLANDGSLGLGVVDPRSVLVNMRQINGSNIISASNLSREVFTLANDGSLGLGVVDPRSVLVNMRQINGSNIISASNLSREVFTLANDGSLGLGVTYPQSVLMNMRQINGSNIISASNLSREVFTLANDGSLGLGVVDPRSVLVNIRQINGSNIISASNLSREVFTLANDGSLGLGVVDPRSVLVNMRQINGSNIISASNLSREVFTLANDGSLGLGVVDPQSVLVNMRQINGSNIISASNLSREVFTLANDGSLGLGVVDPQSVLVNMRQINGSNIISASNLSREVFTLANDGSLGLGVTDPRSVLMNMKQINGSNIISASNLSREVFTLANDGSLGLGVVDPQSVLMNMRQINGSNIISASNLSREVFTLANDGSLGLGVVDPQSVLMNMRQINGSNIISASNLSREVFTLANDGSLGLGVVDPRSVLVNMRQINGSNIISASNLSREVFTLANDGSLGLGVVDPRSVLVNMRQINGSNIISASNLSREVFTLANDGSLGLGVVDPRSVLVNMRQINGSNIISASNLSREVFTLANDGSLGLGVVDPQSVLVNMRQINGSNIISASNLSREVFTLANDGSLGLGVVDPRSVLVNMRQINGSNIISASNLSREVFTLANDGSLGLGVVDPRSVLVNMRQINGSNIISASNLSREVFTLANDGSLGLGVVDPQSVLMNMRQINGSNIISASNLSREVFTLANDGSLGLGVVDPQSVLMNMRQINGSNIISASNLSREVFTLANDGSLGLGVVDPRCVLVNMRQINGSNIISASNLSREVFTLANDGSLGLGVVDPRSVLVNMRQINGSNIISASNLSREVFTLANDGSLGLGVVDPRSVLVNMRQINGSNIISASNLSREVFTLANDGSLGLGVVDPQSVLMNMRQINGSNIISASNLSREVFTLANDGSLGLGVVDPQSVLMNMKQINGSNIISASNLSREVFTLANDGSLGLGVTDPRRVLMNMKQINGSNIISASNLSREVFTLANDGSLGLGVTDPRSVLMNMKQINGSNIISASNLSREVFTLANDGSLGLGVTDPRSVLMNMKQINGSNIISASNLSREVFTLANDGSLGLGVTDPRSVLMNMKQINGSNIISASNLSREVFTLANDGSLGLGVVDPRSVLVNMKQINGSNIISASNLSREVFTLANDGSLGLGVVDPRSVLVNMRQINGSNIISASNLSREVFTLANDGSLGLGVVEPQSVLVNMRQINGSNIISASNLSREVFTLANDGSIGLGVVEPQSVLVNMRQINGSNIISASNLSREVFTLANDGSIGLGVVDPRSVLVNIKQINGSNIISASNLSREVFTLANDGSLGLGVVNPQSVLVNMRQINGSNIISASNLSREVFTLANDGSLGLGVVEPQSVLVNMRQINGSNIISASNLSREVFTLANDGSLGLGVVDPQSVLVNMRQINGSYIISASNLSREVFTLANDGSLGLGVVDPQSVLMNMRQINGSNIISASNLSREVFTLTNDGILGIGVNNPNKQSKLDVNGNINIVDNNSSGYIYTINNRDIIKDTCNYVEKTSNIISKRITDLSADYIADGNNNRFIINDRYNRDLYVNGQLTASNLIIHGSVTTLNTDIYATEQLNVTNSGQGTAVTINQIANNNNIFSASNLDTSVFNIKYDGKIGINTDNPRVFLEINTKDGIKIPSGTTSERPATADLVAGTIRYNTTTTQFEGYGPGNNWGSLGGVKDVNNDTYISAETEPGSNNDELQFYTSNIRKMTIKKDGKIGINTYEPRVFLEINTNDGIKIPSGTTSERPATADLVAGTIRYNTTTTQFEGYGPGNNWGSLGGVKDVNNDTYISAETEPGINNDELQFYTSNIRKMTIKKDGKIGINTYEPRVFLEINTNDGIKIPSGTTSERPATADLVAGTIRYNTTTTQFEGYGPGNNWGSLGGVKDVNNDTYISAETEPGINNDELQFYTSNIRKMTIKKDGKIGINTYEPRVFLEINTKDGIKIPSGTTLERPATADLVAGTIRYNTTTTQFEGYGPGNNWGSLGGVKDVNNDTYISAETEPGINNDELQFYTSNIRKMTIKKDGKIGINTYEPRVFLEINTNDGIKIPSGTTLERPATADLVAGTIRYNTTTTQFEGYGPGNNWGSLGGVKDVNNDTYISAETEPGSNNDELQFYTSNIRKMIITKDGNVGIGSNILNPDYLLDVKGEVRVTSNLFVNSNISIGTYNTDALLNIYGNSANIKIQDPTNNVQGNTSIELINGPINKIQSNILTSWKMSNSNNFYIISSGSNNLIKDRLLINGTDGNIGVGTKPNHTLDVYGTLNASNYRINGKPFVLEFTQGMIVQTIHKTYRETKTKSDNTTGWIAIDNDINTGFIVSIKPSHASSKVLVNMSCHIGMDYAENSRWWGIQLYRKIGSTGNWTLVENANGSNSQGLEGSPCWISHNMGADNSLYSHSIINVSGSYEDLPNSTEIVYYTAYWKSKLNNTFGRLYLNRPATINSSYTSNYPLTSSSWTASEIWNNGISYTPTDATITIAHNNVGIGITPIQNTLFRLDVDGLIRSTNITHTSDYRTKKNIENIDNALDNINRLNPVSYLTLNQNNDDKKSYGFIAQELKEIFPYIVNEPVNNADLYSINYISIIPLLTKSIQELTMKIGIMQDEINALKSI